MQENPSQDITGFIEDALEALRRSDVTGAKEILDRLFLMPGVPQDGMALICVLGATTGVRDRLGAITEMLAGQPAAWRILLCLVPFFALAGRHEDAMLALRRAMTLPAPPVEWDELLSNVLQKVFELGYIDLAVALLDFVAELKPKDLFSGFFRIAFREYQAGTSETERRILYRDLGSRHQGALIDHSRQPGDVDRPLVIGFINEHASQIVTSLVPHLDPTEYSTICYHDPVKQWMNRLDEVPNLRAVNMAGMSADELCRTIRDDRVDILMVVGWGVPVAVYDALARHPAPVQVNWADLGARGNPGMDYFLTDRHHVPPGCDEEYDEVVVRLPRTSSVFRRLDDRVGATPLPCLSTGHVTFGSLNRPSKITPAVVALWASIMHAVPNSRMVLGFWLYSKIEPRQRILDLFAANGIAADRIEFVEAADHADFLGAYAGIDMSLDTFPFNGGITTLEASWAGVPVITLRGQSFGGRLAAGLLVQLGLDDLVTDNIEDYRARAVALASDIPALAGLRQTVRQRMEESLLFDAPLFAEEWTIAVRAMWRHWVEHGRVRAQN